MSQNYNVISVIMPVYRANLEHLKDAIDSILGQTFSKFELIILYEPSSDYEGDEALKRFLEDLIDERVRMVTLPVKTGLSRSLNRGIEIAKGKYIARMDADDIAVLDRFEKQYAYLEKHRDVDILGGVAKILGREQKSFKNIPSPELRPIRMMFENAGIAHPTAVYRKASFEKANLKYDESLHGSEDYKLWADAVMHGLRIDSLTDVVLHYRVSDTQASARLSTEMAGWDGEIRLMLGSRISKFDEDESEIFKSFMRCEKARFDAKKYEQIFLKLIEDNRRKCIYGKAMFENELVWQWVRRGFYQLRRCGNKSILLSAFSLKILRPVAFLYCMQQASAIVCSRH